LPRLRTVTRWEFDVTRDARSPRSRRKVSLVGSWQQQPSSTRERIIAAAIATLQEEGFAGTSARSIARRGSFNQALIFYHFGSVLDVLITALERMSADRLAQYRAAVAGAPDLRTALAVARDQYTLDVHEGHITVLAEMVAGASSVPQLGPEIVRCMAPWIEFAEETIKGFLAGTPLEVLIPAREAAHALLAIYLGMELLDHLDPEAHTAEPLFHVAERMLAAVEPFIGLRAQRSDASTTRRPQRVPLDDTTEPQAIRKRSGRSRKGARR
jgi:AcrR family transcriptional regulator